MNEKIEELVKQSESKKEEDRLAKLAKYRNEINTNATFQINHLKIH